MIITERLFYTLTPDGLTVEDIEKIEKEVEKELNDPVLNIKPLDKRAVM